MVVFSHGKGYMLIFQRKLTPPPTTTTTTIHTPPPLTVSYKMQLHFHTSIRRIFSSAISTLLQFSFPVINGRLEFVSDQQAKITRPKIMRAFCYLSNVHCPDVHRRIETFTIYPRATCHLAFKLYLMWQLNFFHLKCIKTYSFIISFQSRCLFKSNYTLYGTDSCLWEAGAGSC